MDYGVWMYTWTVRGMVWMAKVCFKMAIWVVKGIIYVLRWSILKFQHK